MVEAGVDSIDGVPSCRSGVKDQMRAGASSTILVHAKDHNVGDGLLQVPFFRSLRHRFPAARVTLAVSVGRSAYASSLKDVVSPFVDEVIENAGLCLEKRQAYARRRPLDDRRFDLVIDMQKTWWRTLAVRRVRHKIFISASKHFLFSDRWPRSFRKPERLVDQFMMLLDATRQDPVGDAPPLRWFGPREEQRARTLLPDGPVHVGLVPGAGDRGKCWPLERYVALAHEQGSRGRRPVFILGPQEGEWVSLLSEAVPNAAMPGWRDGELDPGMRNPMQVAALGGRLAAAVANDCGTAHMLAAGETPLVSLFGYTNGAKYQPATPRFRRLDARAYGSDDVAAIPYADVAAALEGLVVADPGATTARDGAADCSERPTLPTASAGRP
jgi:ADP-heptose:LPS heptosyltransferase